MDNGVGGSPGHPGVDIIPPLTSRERWDYLLGSSLFFLLGALATDSLVFAIIVPEVLFVAGWVYLAGACSDDRPSWALFVGSVIAAAGGLVAFALFVVPPDTPSWLLAFVVVGPYFPVVFVPVVAAHALVFVYLAARLGTKSPRPSVLITMGGVALGIVAIAGLAAEGPEATLPASFFAPIGYALIALGARRETRRVRVLARAIPPSPSGSSFGPP